MGGPIHIKTTVERRVCLLFFLKPFNYVQKFPQRYFPREDSLIGTSQADSCHRDPIQIRIECNGGKGKRHVSWDPVTAFNIMYSVTLRQSALSISLNGPQSILGGTF